jgi:hypothetical protein
VGNLKFKHLILPLIFGFILFSAVEHGQRPESLYETNEFTVALNQLYVHCNHRDWQEIRILLTTKGNSGPILVNRIYISYGDSKRCRLPVQQFEFDIRSGDVVKEVPIVLTGTYLDENQHHKVPYITIMLTHGNRVFWLKNSGPVW